MKRQIDCDHVFDILTRGPFPNGDATDTGVEMHLIACHDCRRLAEALRPAIDLFHETVPATELEDLPGYHGVLCRLEQNDPLPRVGTLVAERRFHGARLQKMLLAATRPDYMAGRFTTAVLLGASLMGLLWTLGLAGSNNRSAIYDRAGSRIVASLGSTHADQIRQLAMLNLPVDCRRTEMALGSEATIGPLPHSAMAAFDASQCCTQCHQASQKNLHSSVALTTIVRSCQICHNGMQRGG